jgi:phosphate starvation-inducible PhoH-like protein
MPKKSRKIKRSERFNKEEQNGKDLSKKALLHPIVPKTVGQEIFLEAINEKPIVICDGPAGSGKTFLSFGSALKEYVSNPDIMRIIVVRPTFTAGDEPALGFLPGGLNDKMEPFLAPILRDSAPLLIRKMPRSPSDSRFIERFGNKKSDLTALLARFDIEIVPLHLMRGRSFHRAFIILDEAQNCSMADFKLFLTRIGKKSRAIIEGDSTQKDRPDGCLPELMGKLHGLNSVATVRLTDSDIIRNPIISEILKRFD